MYAHILLPTDGSELSKMAVREGVDLAKALGARVTVVTVTTPFHVLTFCGVFTTAYYELLTLTRPSAPHAKISSGDRIAPARRVAARRFAMKKL
jgi:nucleotide-binding universal stress UspA family protein